MPLNAYHPLEQVYKFHEPAERWMLRRYLAQVIATTGAERRRALAFGEQWIDVFPHREPERTNLADPGQQTVERRTIYTRTRVRMTDRTSDQPSDVLFDPEGNAWQAVEDGRWDEARGFAVVVERAGKRGVRPWA